MKRGKSVVDVFIAKDRLALLWFLVAAGAILFCAWDRHRTLELLKKETRFLVMDSASTWYLPANLDFESAKDVHADISRLAVEAMFQRNPGGFDNPERLRRILGKSAYKKIQESARTEMIHFREQSIHQKVEYAPVTVLQTQGDYVLTRTTGQLIRSGLFEGKAFTVVLDLEVNLKLVLNPDMRSNGRYPLVAVDFDFKTRRKA